MEHTFKILSISGSLRQQSCNTGLLEAAVALAPPGCRMEIFDLSVLPFYNEDYENPLPPPVVAFKKKIREAEALLIATPEYNYSIPGVLKNALDWASRPYGDNAWHDKPLAIMGASPAIQGTSRAQYHLRQVCVTLNMHPLNQPEVLIGNYADKFDAQGKLIDVKTQQKITDLLKALVDWANRLKN